MTDQKYILITGTSRGLGLSFTEKFLERGWTVFAGAREPDKSEGLAKLRKKYSDSLFPVQLDVASDRSVVAACGEVAKRTDRLDIVLNNAGVYGDSRGITIAELDLEEIQSTFNVNTLGPLRVTRAFYPLLKKGREKKLIQITSLMGSIDDNSSGGSYGYRLSKAALNMLNKNFAVDLAKDGIISLTLHPGWVKTDMGGAKAPMDIATSVDGMMNVIFAFTKDRSGSFLCYDGKAAPY